MFFLRKEDQEVQEEIIGEKVVGENPWAIAKEQYVRQTFTRSGRKVKSSKIITRQKGWVPKPEHQEKDVCQWCGTLNSCGDKSLRINWACRHCGNV